MRDLPAASDIAQLLAAIASIPWNIFVFGAGMMISGVPESDAGEVVTSCAKKSPPPCSSRASWS